MLRCSGRGSAYAANTVRSTDIVDGQVNSADVKDQSLNGSLKDEDIAKTALVDLPVDVGTVPAHDCRTYNIDGIGGPGNHLLLSPAYESTSIYLTYTIFTPRINTSPDAVLQVCNPTDNPQSGGATSHFNLLVIDAH